MKLTETDKKQIEQLDLYKKTIISAFLTMMGTGDYSMRNKTLMTIRMVGDMLAALTVLTDNQDTLGFEESLINAIKSECHNTIDLYNQQEEEDKKNGKAKKS